VEKASDEQVGTTSLSPIWKTGISGKILINKWLHWLHLSGDASWSWWLRGLCAFEILWAEYLLRLSLVSALKSSESSGWPLSTRNWQLLHSHFLCGRVCVESQWGATHMWALGQWL